MFAQQQDCYSLLSYIPCLTLNCMLIYIYLQTRQIEDVSISNLNTNSCGRFSCQVWCHCEYIIQYSCVYFRWRVYFGKVYSIKFFTPNTFISPRESHSEWERTDWKQFCAELSVASFEFHILGLCEFLAQIHHMSHSESGVSVLAW